jgi:hypothetical protein
MKTVLIALAAGLMVFEFTSVGRAALGWTLDQCKSHFGSEPLTSQLDDMGLMEYEFRTRGYTIRVTLKAGTVISVIYLSLNIDGDTIQALLSENAPNADWNHWALMKNGHRICSGNENGFDKYCAILSQETLRGTPLIRLQVSSYIMIDLLERKHKILDL